MFNKLNDGIYSVGVINPNLRIFDIIMDTKYGTTYNAYLIKAEKIALIETVHEKYFDEYLENIQALVDIKEIDYIILNHTEPDHTGSVARILELNPDITVISTAPGNKYVNAITNTKFKSQIVKNNDTLDLGGKILKFIVAPFLHWPDSMFTYIEQDKTLFSCDFLGAHYCEPICIDSSMKYKEDYDYSFKYYFDCIFAPFKKYVLEGLDKIKDLDIEMICTSHGPVLVDHVASAQKNYRSWCEETLKTKETKKCLVIYVSAYGYTKNLAEAAYDKLKADAKCDVEIIDIIKDDILVIKEKLDEADAIMIGSPTINRDALKPVWDVLSTTDAILNRGKVVGIFGSYGWSGEAVAMIKARAISLGLKVVEDGFRVNFKPTEEDLEAMKEYTSKFITEAGL